MLASSGDSGVTTVPDCDLTEIPFIDNCACSYDSSSHNNIDGRERAQSKNTWTGVGYFPLFPASCPFVTAVGGTQFSNPSKNFGYEISSSADTDGYTTSGGGFSAYYSRLDWQTNAVNLYFDNVFRNEIGTPTRGYNKLGRGYPDVAMNAFGYNVIVNGVSSSTYGTAASVLVMAAQCK